MPMVNNARFEIISDSTMHLYSLSELPNCRCQERPQTCELRSTEGGDPLQPAGRMLCLSLRSGVHMRLCSQGLRLHLRLLLGLSVRVRMRLQTTSSF